VKNRGPAEVLIRSIPDAEWEVIANSPRVLFHARATTKGTEAKPENNHPVVGYDWVVTHNGHVNNDDELWDYYGEERFAEVDTSAIPLVLHKGGEGEGKDLLSSLSYLSILSGSITVAVWSQKYLDHIALARLGSNDLYLFLDEDILYWSSAPVAARIMPGTTLGNLRFITWAKLPDNRILLLRPDEPFGTMYEVDRRPFVRRSWSVKSTTNTGGVATSSPSSQLALPPARSKGGALTLEKLAPKEYPDRPPMSLPAVDKFSWKTTDLLEIGRGLRSSSISKATVFSTMGRWIFNKTKSSTEPEIVRTFKPYKSVKKFLRRNIGHVPVFPVIRSRPGDPVEPGTSAFYDNRMTLIALRFSEPLDSGGVFQTMGYICPWCGVWGRYNVWSATQYRCEFCGIQSKHEPPKPSGEGGKE
jgi:hypothetical protein